MMRYGYSMMGGLFGMMIIPIIIIGIVVFLISSQFSNIDIKDIKAGDNSLDVLNERFARGEINEDEYYNKKNILRKCKS
ncbi:hypothetical protein [Clostridium sp.]